VRKSESIGKIMLSEVMLGKVTLDEVKFGEVSDAR